MFFADCLRFSFAKVFDCLRFAFANVFFFKSFFVLGV